MDSSIIFLLVLSIFFLLGSVSLTAFSSALMTYGKIGPKSPLVENKTFPFFSISFFVKKEWDDVYLILNLTKHLVLLFYTTCLFLFFLKIKFNVLLAILLLVLISLAFNFIIQFFDFFSKRLFYVTSFISTIYIFLFYPITSLFLKLSKKIFEKKTQTVQLMDIFYNLDIKKIIDPKILSSLITFNKKVAREVMIPRVKVFSLSSKTTIKEASSLILSEGYSRIPVYKDKIDNIIGVLMYKDVLKTYIQTETENKENLLDSTIDMLIKPVIYAPENKKISHLFQEFRTKQRHMAIIVNEYGGTEGIITIEDILEELVGEIQDEYDVDEERQFWQLPNNSWIVDAKTSIIDIEKKLNIHIPHSPEYETISGFLFHRAGAIPKKGWSLHLDEFDIEVLISNERSIEKIKITPLDRS
jgi:CBS domain containing-hemolysin-like protein